MNVDVAFLSSFSREFGPAVTRVLACNGPLQVVCAGDISLKCVGTRLRGRYISAGGAQGSLYIRARGLVRVWVGDSWGFGWQIGCRDMVGLSLRVRNLFVFSSLHSKKSQGVRFLCGFGRNLAKISQTTPVV